MPDGDRVDVTVGEVVWDLVAVADGDCELVAEPDVDGNAMGIAAEEAEEAEAAGEAEAEAEAEPVAVAEGLGFATTSQLSVPVG